MFLISLSRGGVRGRILCQHGGGGPCCWHMLTWGGGGGQKSENFADMICERSLKKHWLVISCAYLSQYLKYPRFVQIVEKDARFWIQFDKQFRQLNFTQEPNRKLTTTFWYLIISQTHVSPHSWIRLETKFIKIVCFFYL